MPGPENGGCLPTGPKYFLKEMLLRTGGIRRVHIVGCSRSGTTMLQYAFVAFENSIIADAETAVWTEPGFGNTLGLSAKYVLRTGRPRYFVTKREPDWFREDRSAALAGYARRHRVFLIHIVRDPRDVLTSNHPKDRRLYYVSPDLWLNSILAGERLMADLRNLPGKLTIRYEDIVRDADGVQATLQEMIGLRLRPQVASWATLADNVSTFGGLGRLAANLQKLRSFDAKTIGRWRSTPDKAAYLSDVMVNSPYGPHIKGFLERYGYDVR